jgi:hypothetical protein
VTHHCDEFLPRQRPPHRSRPLAASLATSLAASALLALTATAAAAMTLERVGGDLFATGPVEPDDVQAFKAELESGGLRRIVFVNSPGGQLRAALQIALMIRKKGVETLVSGYCHSACSLLFIAGRERRFATGHKPRNTQVGIHGASSRATGELRLQAAPRMMALYKAQMGAKFREDIIGRALTGITDHNGMLRVREIDRTRPGERVPWFCPSSQTPFERCEKYTDVDALSLGVVTSPETVAIELPKSMQMRIDYFGVALEERADGIDEVVRDAAGAACLRSTRCAEAVDKAITRWTGGDIHRAVAVGLERPSFAFRSGDDHPVVALRGALYACNHVRNEPKLCRLLAVDDREVPDLTREAKLRSRELLRRLPEPEANAVMLERSESGTYRTAEIRTEPLQTLAQTVTPKRLEGIETLDTVQVARALRGRQPPLLIDVGEGGQAMLPTALHFIQGGRAHDDERRDAEFDDRFRAMLGAAGASPQRELIFYAADSGSWLAVNAALRARRAGYALVGWYRGGLAAWQQAGMPVVRKAAVAVLN